MFYKNSQNGKVQSSFFFFFTREEPQVIRAVCAAESAWGPRASLCEYSPVALGPPRLSY